MMNMKHFLLLLALGGLGVSCSNDDLVDNGGGTPSLEGRTELQVVFSGTGASQEYTRAIASDNENAIDKLDVYLFAAASQGGPYYYLETWKEGTAFNPAAPSTDFQKQASGTGWKATLYPGEQKGLPWIKLLCVANNGSAGSGTTDGKFYTEGGATETLTALTAVTVNGDGNVTNAGAATKEEDFRKSYTVALGADAATGVIGYTNPAKKEIAPLLMTGEGTTKISGSVSKVDISLKRVMARFDIENKTSSSSLTIESVSLAQGRKSASLWNGAPTVVDKADFATSPLMASYQPVTFKDIPGANLGMLESAYYVYPGLATDESYLIIKGKYKSPVTSTQVDVTYNVPIVRTPEGAAPGTPGEYIPLKANSRYKLRITDVSQSNVFGSFEVVDWTSGGGITIRPDNDSPVFAGKAAFEGANPPTVELPVPAAPKNSFEVDGATGTFTVTIGATGKVRAEKGDVVVRALGGEWLNISLTGTQEKDGVWYSTFKIDYNNAIGQKPVAIHFINESASYDPALWTTLNFYGPKAVPSFAVLTTDGVSKGNTTDAADASAPKASLYTMNGSFVKFDITCLEGLLIDVTGAAGYTATEEKVTGLVHTYKIAVSDAGAANGGTIVFKNAGDDTKTTTLTLTGLDPILTFTEGTDADNAGEFTPTAGGPDGVLKIDLDALNSYTFKVNAPQGIAVPTNLADCPWLTITESKAWTDADGNRYAEYTVTPKNNPANTDDFELVFGNSLTENGITAPGLKVALHKDFSKPKLSATTGADNGLNEAVSIAADGLTATGKMYLTNHAGNQLQIDAACPEEMDVTATGGLTATKGSGNTYTITTDGTTIVAGATATVTFANKNAAVKKVVLTVTMVDPGMSVTKVSGTYLEVANAVATIDVAEADANYDTNGGVLDILAPKGSTVQAGDPASDWVTVTPVGGSGTPTVDHATAVKWKLTLKDAADRGSSSYADYQIVIHNTATDADEYVTIKKKP